jgi:hypothetical protein
MSVGGADGGSDHGGRAGRAGAGHGGTTGGAAGTSGVTVGGAGQAGTDGTAGAAGSGAEAGQAGAGAAGDGGRHWSAGKAACGDVECDAFMTQSGSASCCYASASDHGCANDQASGCGSFPATLLHCDSDGDCTAGSSPAERLCVLDVTNRLAICGGAAPDGVTQIELCEPGQTCVVGTCQATTLNGKLPPDYWACLP